MLQSSVPPGAVWGLVVPTEPAPDEGEAGAWGPGAFPKVNPKQPHPCARREDAQCLQCVWCPHVESRIESCSVQTHLTGLVLWASELGKPHRGDFPSGKSGLLWSRKSWRLAQRSLAPGLSAPEF